MQNYKLRKTCKTEENEKSMMEMWIEINNI